MLMPIPSLSPIDAPGTRRGLVQFYCILLPMLGLIALGFLLKQQAFAFIDIGGDTFVQFLPLQVATVHQLHELHTLTWSFELGLGGYLGATFDPFWCLAAFFPESSQTALRLPLYLLKLLLGGGFFYAYLRVLGLRHVIAVIGGLGYAFSAYAIVNGQWDGHGDEIPQFATYLFLLELYWRNRRVGTAVLAGVLIGIGATFSIYTFALLSCVYVLLRSCFVRSGLQADYWRGAFGFACWCTLGLLLLAPLQFPGLYYLFDSPRVSGEHLSLAHVASQLFHINDRATISAELAGLFGKDLLGTGNAYKGWGNYFEGPGFYVGLLPLLCILQLLGPCATRRERRACLIGLIVIALYFVFPALRFAVYGFGHIAFRFSTVWVSAALLVLGVLGLNSALRTGVWRPGLAVAAGGLALIVLACTALQPIRTDLSQGVRVFGFIAVYLVLLWRVADREALEQLLPLLVTVVACELLLFASPALLQRPTAPIHGDSTAGNYDDGTLQALRLAQAHDQDGDFYRIEKTYGSVFLCDALMQHYAGVKSYYFHGSSVVRFVDAMGFSKLNASTSYIEAPVAYPGMLDLLGVKYVLSRDRAPDGPVAMTYLGNAGGIAVFRNETARGFASFYTQLISEDAANALTLDERRAALADAAVVADVPAIDAQLAVLDAGVLRADLEPAAALHKLRDDHLAGAVHTSHAQLLLLSMPFDPGWSARLDGVTATLFRADYGLTALLVPAGSYQLDLSYLPPGRRLGWQIATVAAVLVMLGLIMQRRRLRTATQAA